ncbi:hypothetical protein M0805_007736 [Coniferiporia weirii]|nr:hypothetical protein M0805_007736 [Coniferiporia weirii]
MRLPLPLLCLSLALGLPLGTYALWPKPRSLSTGSSALRLSPSFTISASFSAPSDLAAAITRTAGYIKTDNLGRLVVGRGEGDAGAVRDAPELKELVLSIIAPKASSGSGSGNNNGKGKDRRSSDSKSTPIPSIATEAVKALGSRDESYVLTVPTKGTSATLSANTTLGLLRGLTTFEQLWYTYNGDIYTLEAPVEITDEPAFPYRGFMLDTARNYFTVADIQHTLDAMSWVKINTFHWHVTDSQSFPLEVPGFTELSTAGAYSASSVYTAEDVADIVAYAGERGIDVLMEIDTPGHTAIIGEAYPEHVACYDKPPWATYANEPPAGQLRLASPATTAFTASLLSAAARLTPSTLFSTGGDELNTPCYTDDEETQAELKSAGKTLEEALDTFTQASHRALEEVGKTPVVWEEMVLDFNLTLSNETVVMVWISSANSAAVADKGFRIVHSPSDYFYLDCGAGEWISADIDGNSWCDPFKTWQKAYSFDPYQNLTASQQSLVLGGQQLLWTEQAGPQNLDSIVWPRAAATAEVFWAGPGYGPGSLSGSGTGAGEGAGTDALNGTEALPRLHDVRYRMVQRGVDAINLQPEWCAVRPQACNLNS